MSDSVDPEGLLLWSQATALTTTRSLREEPMGGIHVTTLAGRSYTGIRVPLEVNELTNSSFLPHTTCITQCCMLFKSIPALLAAFLDGGKLLIHGAINNYRACAFINVVPLWYKNNKKEVETISQNWIDITLIACNTFRSFWKSIIR